MAINPWNIAGVAPYLLPGAEQGQVYYVDGQNGDNGNTGVDPRDPKLTITNALLSCTAGNGDTIVVLQYPADGVPAGETLPITVDVHRVRILGALHPHMEADKPAQILAATDEAIFDIDAQWVEIAYLHLSGGHGHGCIEFHGTPVECKGFSVHHCQFAEKYGSDGQPVYGIWMEGGNNLHASNWCYIAYNVFYPSITTNGIWIDSNPAYPVIHGNTFLRTGGIAVNVTRGAAGGRLTDNRFALLTDTTGLAITFTAAAVGDAWWVDGNHAHYGAAAMGQNPYRDLSVIPVHLKNTWGVNWVGAASTMPVTV